MEILPFLAGVILLALGFWDVFETIVVPRPTPSRLRLTRHIVPRTWRLWRAIGERRQGVARDLFLGLYAPAAAVLLLATWILTLVLGYALVLYAIRDQLEPVPQDFGSVLYFAGTSLLTVGYGDMVPAGPLARFVSLAAAATGLGIVALVITFLFSLFGSYQRREILVVQLQARAKAPPSAVTLLENYARLDLVAELPELFADWERWSAEVLDSHVAYPILPYFRSSHDNVSWVSALGAVLDASALVLTTIEDGPTGEATMVQRVGGHFVEDLSNFFGWRNEPMALVERSEFDAACERLKAAGWRIRDQDRAWQAFVGLRSEYAARLNDMALFWVTPPALWIGDRGVVRHLPSGGGT